MISIAFTAAAWEESNALSTLRHTENIPKKHPHAGPTPNATQHVKPPHWLWPTVELALRAPAEHARAPLPHPYAPSGNINSLSIGRQVILGQRKCFLFPAGCLEWAQSEVCIETSRGGCTSAEISANISQKKTLISVSALRADESQPQENTERQM